MAAAPVQSAVSGKVRVLEAAHGLFAEGSYGDVGVALILERAGVQAPTLYHHFGDKEGLYAAWAETVLDRVGATVSRACRLDGSTAESLLSYAIALLTTVQFDVPQVLRDIPKLNKPASQDRIMSAYMRAVYEPLATILVQAVATREFRQEPIPELTDAFLGGLLSLRSPASPVEDRVGRASWWCDAFMRAFRR